MKTQIALPLVVVAVALLEVGCTDEMTSPDPLQMPVSLTKAERVSAPLGTWTSGTLTVTFTEQTMTCTRGKTVECYSYEVDGYGNGWYMDCCDEVIIRVVFSYAVQGETLTYTVGKKTYRLTRQYEQENPKAL